MTLPVRIIKARKKRRVRPAPEIDPRGRSVPIVLDPEAPETAGASLLVNRYPAALDTLPTITDNQTPLSGIFLNYLALMLEACMAELGPMPDLPSSLKDYLGMQFANTISNWRSFTKTLAGGNEAGQIFGLIKQAKSHAAVGYANEQNASARTNQGHLPSGKQPVLFGEVIRGPFTINSLDVVNGIGGGVRGEVTGVIGSTITYKYRGAPGGPFPASTPQGGFTQPSNILLAFLLEA